MNKNSQLDDTASVAMGFVLGAVVGAGLALLFAPATGTDTRGRLADRGRRLGGAVRSKVDDVLHTAKDLEQEVKIDEAR